MELIGRLPIKKLSRFAAIGLMGFVVDVGVAITLIGLGLSPFAARIISIGGAMLVTWRLNRAFTFGASETSQAAEGMRYAIVAVFVASFNYAVYAGLVAMAPQLPIGLAIAVSTAASMSLSFIGYGRFAFGKA